MYLHVSEWPLLNRLKILQLRALIRTMDGGVKCFITPPSLIVEQGLASGSCHKHHWHISNRSMRRSSGLDGLDDGLKVVECAEAPETTNTWRSNFRPPPEVCWGTKHHVQLAKSASCKKAKRPEEGFTAEFTAGCLAVPPCHWAVPCHWYPLVPLVSWVWVLAIRGWCVSTFWFAVAARMLGFL